MQKIVKILEESFHKKGWTITKPSDGWEEGSYIGSLNSEKYFIKFGVNPLAMIRLSELKITPKVIKTGQINGENYMIQKFIEGNYVPREWLADNLIQLADFQDIYHSDIKLAQIINQTSAADRLSIEGEINNFKAQLDKVFAKNEFTEIRQAINELLHRYNDLPVVDLVPVHDDPNTNNIFLAENGLQMIDWNKIRLSDPLSDTGAILWWYVPPERWDEFFHQNGKLMNDEIIERIYLAAAKMTMGFIVWCIEHQKDYFEGLVDFNAAIHKGANPKAWFK